MNTLYATGIGAALGVVAGSLVRYGAGLIHEYFSHKTKKEILIKELKYNISLVNLLIKECEKLRNSVNGKSLVNYFGYFRLSDGLFIQTVNMLQSGDLYKIFNDDHLQRFQRVVFVLSVNNTNWVNNQVAYFKDAQIANIGTYNHTGCVGFVDYLENDLTQTRDNLNALSDVLSSKQT